MSVGAYVIVRIYAMLLSANRLIVVLEKACLETVKSGKNYELLNCDDHAHILKKHKREAAECRPDIAHQVCTIIKRSATRMLALVRH
jgi:rRNA small subunit pseudouridine methyltransferase Nep1